MELEVVDWDDLIDPANETGDFDINAGDIYTSAAEAPGDQASEFIEAVVFADQRAASIALTSIVLLAASTKAGGWQNEYLLGHCIDFPNALGIADDGQFGFTDSQGDGARFAHIAVAGHSASLASGMIDIPGRQTDLWK